MMIGVMLLVIKLQIHAVLNLVVLQRDVVLVDGVPLLQNQLFVSRARLGGDQLLQIADCVILVALYSDLLAQTVVHDDLKHVRRFFERANEKNKFSTLQVCHFELDFQMKTVSDFMAMLHKHAGCCCKSPSGEQRKG